LTIDNTPPVADAGDNITIKSIGIASTAVHGSASDFDGDALSCRWMEGATVLQDWMPAGANGECPPLGLSSLSLAIGTHILTLEANDGQTASSDEMVLTIDNSAPHAAPADQVFMDLVPPYYCPVRYPISTATCCIMCGQTAQMKYAPAIFSQLQEGHR